MRLEQFGWNSEFQHKFDKYASQGYGAGRVRLAWQDGCVLLTGQGDIEATVAGRLLDADSGADHPIVGDWVAFSTSTRRIEALLARKSEIARRRPGGRAAPQVLAANIDLLLVVSAFGRDFNPRRMERYLVLARQSGADPVLVLNKVDECSDPAEALRQVRPIAEGAPVVLLSALNAVGLEDLLLTIGEGQTAALLGSSGVGKSTIVNQLLGEERQRVNALGDANRRGRHTTTARELFLLPGGQLLIDTPGLRELQLWGPPETADTGFPDIARLGRQCRFRDCRHQGEPDCAVRAAVEAGELDPLRLENYHRIGRELKHLERQSDGWAAFEERQRIKRIHRSYRKMPHR